LQSAPDPDTDIEPVGWADGNGLFGSKVNTLVILTDPVIVMFLNNSILDPLDILISKSDESKGKPPLPAV